MTTLSKTRPLYRVLFAPITGQDDQGKEQCGPAREIGAVWPRKERTSCETRPWPRTSASIGGSGSPPSARDSASLSPAVRRSRWARARETAVGRGPGKDVALTMSRSSWPNSWSEASWSWERIAAQGVDGFVHTLAEDPVDRRLLFHLPLSVIPQVVNSGKCRGVLDWKGRAERAYPMKEPEAKAFMVISIVAPHEDVIVPGGETEDTETIHGPL